MIFDAMALLMTGLVLTLAIQTLSTLLCLNRAEPVGST